MRLCVRCSAGLTSSESDDICSYHLTDCGDEWAIVNKAYCDMFHRGVPLPRVQEEPPPLDTGPVEEVTYEF